MSTSDARSASASGARLGCLVALRIGEEELDRLGAAGGGRGQRVGGIDMGSDAHGTSLRRGYDSFPLAPNASPASSRLVSPRITFDLRTGFGRAGGWCMSRQFRHR